MGFWLVPCNSKPRHCCLLVLFPALVIFTSLSPILYQSLKVLLSPHSQKVYKMTFSENTVSLFYLCDSHTEAGRADEIRGQHRLLSQLREWTELSASKARIKALQWTVWQNYPSTVGSNLLPVSENQWLAYALGSYRLSSITNFYAN